MDVTWHAMTVFVAVLTPPRTCFVQEECPAAPVQCLHQVVGCMWKGARRELTGHVEDCAYEKIKGLIPRVSASLKKIHTQVWVYHDTGSLMLCMIGSVASSKYTHPCVVTSIQYYLDCF